MQTESDIMEIPLYDFYVYIQDCLYISAILSDCSLPGLLL